jgi:Cu(I)/Ag(I) efflux system protein CusF
MQRISMWSVSCSLSLFVFTGCVASYTPPPLTPQHPAHPEAPAAPALPPSNTLAYGPSDRPSPQPAMAMAQHGTMAEHGGPGAPMAQQPSQQPMAMAQYGGHGAQVAQQPSQQTVVGEGKVVAVVPSSSQIVVDHKEIKGFMDAMTMGYRIKPPSLLEGVKTGDSIRFTIDTQQKAIVKIEKMKE